MNRLNRYEDIFAIGVFTIMALLPFLESFTRLIGILSLPASQVIVQHLTLWIGFIGAILATRQNKLLALTHKPLFIDEEKFQTLADEINSFDVIHPSIGENYSYLNTIRKKQNLELNFILSEEDKFSWQFSNKGYFNFKNNIPKILTNFNLQ